MFYDCFGIFSCTAPMRFAGAYVTNITLPFCPTLDSTFGAKKGFTLSNLKPKHVLWSILGVATVVAIGMLLGLLVKAVKAFYNKKIRSQPIRYRNINADVTFA